jgi:hypothetical protein
MQTLYKLNADELNNEFLESIKALFPHKTIEVAIHEIDDENPSEVDVQRDKFSSFPTGLKLTGDELHHGRAEYLTMAVDEIDMPPREARYER